MADLGVGMEKGKLREHLAVARHKPVSCALGLSKSGAVLLLDKVKTPKSLLNDLEKKFSDLKTPNYGVVTVDKTDHRLVVFQLERRSQGLALKLKRALKETDYSKIKILNGDGTQSEAAGENDDDGAAAPANATPASAAPAGAPPAGAEAVAAASAPPPTAPAEAPAAPGASLPDMAPFNAAKQTWSDARTTIEREVMKLHAAMTKHYKGHAFGPHLDRAFASKVEPMMNRLDRKLVHKLDELTNNTDPAAHAKLVGEAKDIIKGYEDYLAHEPIIAKLDANPFVPLTIKTTLAGSLESLSSTIV